LFFVILGASQLVNDGAWGKYFLLMGMIICMANMASALTSPSAGA
jgi:hypothetical protein